MTSKQECLKIFQAKNIKR